MRKKQIAIYLNFATKDNAMNLQILSPSINVYACPQDFLTERFLLGLASSLSHIPNVSSIGFYVGRDKATYESFVADPELGFSQSGIYFFIQDYDELVSRLLANPSTYFFVLNSKSFLAEFPSSPEPLLNQLRAEYQITFFMQWHAMTYPNKSKPLMFSVLAREYEWIDSLADAVWFVESVPYSNPGYLLSLLHAKHLPSYRTMHVRFGVSK